MIPFNWTNLESTKIKRAKFAPNTHDERGDLLVEFSEGKVYRYKDVPVQHVEDLVHSSSPGSYFHNKIRGVYDAEQVK